VLPRFDMLSNLRNRNAPRATSDLACPQHGARFAWPLTMARPAAPETAEHHSIARNKRARHDYHILETWEAGIVLTGTEVKSLRNGKANMTDAYAIVRDGEIFLLNLHIAPYEQGNQFNHEPTRTRKLLLHRREIRRLIGSVERQGLTLIPLDLYFKKGKAKVVVALGKGKKLHDKRATERERDAQREMARVARTR
jgi:SsrA-binding protein